MIDHHVDRPGVEVRQRAKLTGPNRPTGSKSTHHPQHASVNNRQSPLPSRHLSDARHLSDEGNRPATQHRTQHRTCITAGHASEPVLGSSPRTCPRIKSAGTFTQPRGCRSRHLGKGWTTWWPWRGARTRSHPELGRENPQRPWYCVSRHGRVGRRQVLQPFPINNPPQTHHPRGVEQPGSSSGS